MPYSLWEFLTFPPEQLREREQTLTWQRREAERLDALRRFEQQAKQKENNYHHE